MIIHSDLSYPVYKKIREMILKNELKPGEKLLQEKLAEQLGVSRTPLLKALQMLEHELLVESIPRRGMYVKKLTVDEMNEIYEVREAFECMAVKLTIRKLTPAKLEKLKKKWQPFSKTGDIDIKAYQAADESFHSLLVDFASNQVLKKAFDLSFIHSKVIQMGLMRPPEVTLPEHLELLKAIENRDEDLAAQLMSNHISKSKEHISKIFNP
jgi:DNA-binding GntR family transcriptional regulator